MGIIHRPSLVFSRIGSFIFSLTCVIQVILFSLYFFLFQCALAVRVGVRVRRITRKVTTEGASFSFVLPSSNSPPASPPPPSPLPSQDEVNELPSVNWERQAMESLDNEVAFEDEDFDDVEEGE